MFNDFEAPGICDVQTPFPKVMYGLQDLGCVEVIFLYILVLLRSSGGNQPVKKGREKPDSATCFKDKQRKEATHAKRRKAIRGLNLVTFTIGKVCVPFLSRGRVYPQKNSMEPSNRIFSHSTYCTSAC